MSKAVLISIRPEWCEKIASGLKTIEVRKTRPKIDTPFKCYIYCTKPKKYNSVASLYVDELYRLPTGEYKYGSSIELASFPDQWNKDNFLNGKVIGEFVCDGVLSHCESSNADLAEQQGCIRREKLFEYSQGRELYGWHISDLVIYDKPKKLNEFIRLGSLRGEELDDHICLYCDLGDKRLDNSCEKTKCSEAYIEYLTYEIFVIDRPPMSWCYVEEL